jgi:DnaK suppressor protein
MLSEPEIAFLRARLIEERAALRETDAVQADAAKPVTLDQTSVGRLSRMDAMQGQAMAIEARRRHRVRLARIEAALQRIAAGDYGLCLVCDEPIDPRRLRVDPTTTLCIGCASAAEDPAHRARF